MAVVSSYLTDCFFNSVYVPYELLYFCQARIKSGGQINKISSKYTPGRGKESR